MVTYLASIFSSSSESIACGSSEAGDWGREGPLPDSYSSSVGPVVWWAVVDVPVPSIDSSCICKHYAEPEPDCPEPAWTDDSQGYWVITHFMTTLLIYFLFELFFRNCET